MADIITQDQAETDLLAQLDEFFLLTKKIDRLIMKRSEMAARIVAATAEIKEGNEAIKAELQQQPDADPEVTPAEEQSLADLEAVAAERVALGTTAPVVDGGTAPVDPGTVPVDTTGNTAPNVDANGNPLDENGNPIIQKGI